METNNNWIEEFNKSKHLLKRPTDLDSYFSAKKLYGIEIDQFTIGKINLPTGEIIVCDPLASLCEETPALNMQVPTGVYDVEVAVVKATKDDNNRYAAVRLKFNKKKAARYENAMIGDEDLSDLEEGDIIGFNVDTGLACICDVAAKEPFCANEVEWYDKHPDSDFYDDCLEEMFEDSYKQYPNYQRDEGDYIFFEIPNTDLSIPMFRTGFGDGAYPIYWGFDKDEKICELIIQFIDIKEDYK